MTLLDALLDADTTGDLRTAVADLNRLDDYGWAVYGPTGRHLGTHPARDIAEYARHDEADAANLPISHFTVRPAGYSPKQVAA